MPLAPYLQQSSPHVLPHAPFDWFYAQDWIESMNSVDSSDFWLCQHKSLSRSYYKNDRRQVLLVYRLDDNWLDRP